MNAFIPEKIRWPLVGALLVACSLGFLIARWTAKTPAPTLGNPSAAASPATRNSIEVDQSHLAAVGITLDTVTPGSLSAEVRAPATIASAPNGQALITARSAGTITRIAKRLGDKVRAGESLAWVESRDAASIAASRTVADSKLALARSVLNREKELYEQRVTPRQDFEAAQARYEEANAEARSASTAATNAHVSADGRTVAVVSPLTGRITSASASLGAFVQSDSELFRVSDPRLVQVEASVTATDAGRIAPDDPAKIVMSTGATVEAHVNAVTPTLNEQTRSATVVLSLDHPQLTLSPGEFVQVLITPRGGAAPNGFVVSEESVQRVDGADVVFVRTEKGFRVQRVSVGSRSGGRAAILSGLKGGEQIASRNAFFLKAELVKSAEEDEE